jgi:hypothetical protein
MQYSKGRHVSQNILKKRLICLPIHKDIAQKNYGKIRKRSKKYQSCFERCESKSTKVVAERAQLMRNCFGRKSNVSSFEVF